MAEAFETPIEHVAPTSDGGAETLVGPWRAPRQMLADQEYDGHTSVHDDATADKLGLPGAPIEGPTHFSQFDPLAVALFGQAWFERGCISAHFETMVVEGEQVQATVTCTGTRTGPASARARATKSTGEPVLSATLTLGDEPTELDERLARMQAKDPGELFIVDRVQVGTTSPAMPTSMGFDEWNGNLYPFSLADKLRAITEPSPWLAAIERWRHGRMVERTRERRPDLTERPLGGMTRPTSQPADGGLAQDAQG